MKTHSVHFDTIYRYSCYQFWRLVRTLTFHLEVKSGIFRAAKLGNVMGNEKEVMDDDREMESKENCINHEKDGRITCRGDLTPYFEAWDHSINKIHLSKVCIYERNDIFYLCYHRNLFLLLFIIYFNCYFLRIYSSGYRKHNRTQTLT